VITTAAVPVELELGGMTCASCATRIERKLNKLPGVTATVNYATEKARLALPDGLTVADAIAAVESAGYTARLPTRDRVEDRRLRALRRRLIVSGVLAVPVVAMSMVPVFQVPGWQWVVFGLAVPVGLWGAWPFHRAAAVNFRHGAATMDTLVSIGVIAALVWSSVALLFGSAGTIGMHMTFRWFGSSDGRDELYFEVASAVTVFLLAGRYFEARAKVRSGAALNALLDLGAKTATLIRDGSETSVPAASLQVGDRFVVRPGEKIATDGIVVDGSSAVDASLLTGEPIPVEVGPGTAVVGSAMNIGGRLVVAATRVGRDTELARIGQMVEQAQTGKAQVQRLADRVSSVFVPIVLGLAAVTLLAWLLIARDVNAAFSAAVATLIIACPCALGLATPTALLVGTGRGAQLGVLIKGPQVLESTRRISVALLDKTGTVTTGRMVVTALLPVPGTGRAELLAFAAAAESGSEHPIGRAVTAAAGVLLTAERFSAEAGSGVRAEVQGRTVLVGKPDWMTDTNGIALDAGTRKGAEEAANSGGTMVAVAWDGRHRGMILVGDSVKPTSRAAIAQLKALGIRPVLLTGDDQRAAQLIAAEVGIDDVVAGVHPAGKRDVVQLFQQSGAAVAMIGDGVNDAAALAQADLGIAMGTGTDVAIEASDITLVRSDLLAAVDAIRLSRQTLRTIKSNLVWAFGYNVAAIPLAMAGLLNPLIAGGAMALSSVFVVSNSLRLRRFRPTEIQSMPVATGSVPRPAAAPDRVLEQP
jgi:Cu+-exporting ATPase